jgi:hypothetical protein
VLSAGGAAQRQLEEMVGQDLEADKVVNGEEVVDERQGGLHTTRERLIVL